MSDVLPQSTPYEVPSPPGSCNATIKSMQEFGEYGRKSLGDKIDIFASEHPDIYAQLDPGGIVEADDGTRRYVFHNATYEVEQKPGERSLLKLAINKTNEPLSVDTLCCAIPIVDSNGQASYTYETLRALGETRPDVSNYLANAQSVATAAVGRAIAIINPPRASRFG